MKCDTGIKQEKGFTLLELLVSCSLTMLIAGLCYQSIFTLNSARQKFNQQTTLIQQKQLTHRTFSQLVADATDIRAFESEIRFVVINENADRLVHIVKLDESGKRLIHVDVDEHILLLEKIDSVTFSSIINSSQSHSTYSFQPHQPTMADQNLPDALAVAIKTEADYWRWQFNREPF